MLLLGIKISTDTQIVEAANEINLTLKFESPEEVIESISSDVLSETEDLTDLVNELVKPTRENDTSEERMFEPPTSLVSLERIRAFAKKDVASQKAPETQESFTQHDYIDELMNNPMGEQRFTTEVESYKNLSGTYVSLNVNGKEHCFQTIDDPFPPSDFTPLSLAMMEISADCKGSNSNPLSVALKARIGSGKNID